MDPVFETDSGSPPRRTWRRQGAHPGLAWALQGPAAGLLVCLAAAALAISQAPPDARAAAAAASLLAGAAVLAAAGAIAGRAVSDGAETRRRDADRLRAALMSSVSHDLRTPLASIVGASTTLQALGDRLPPESRASLVDAIAEQARRLDLQIQNLLDASRLEHGAVRAAAEWVDLRDTVAAARARLGGALAEPALEQRIPEDAAFVRADPALLEQIVVNILDNAVRHGGAGGAVRVEARAHAGAVVLSVADDGPGVPAERRRRIFEPFNGWDGRDRRTAGSGLGLSIARGFARAMGGDVRLGDAPEPAPGGAPALRGAAFDIVLPRTKTLSAGTGTRVAAARRPGGGR